MAVLAVVLLAIAMAPAIVTGGEPAGLAAADAPSQVGEPTPTANDTIRHEDPEAAGEEGDLQTVKGWLAGRIGARLEESAINLSQGQYDAARGLLDQDTRDFLGRFVDVAGDTAEDDDDETAETLNETVTEQRNFTQTRRNYSELYEAYLAALQAGDVERARQLARELAALERDLNRTGRQLIDNYRAIANRTEVELTQPRRIIREEVQNVSARQASIRAELFAETRIEVESISARASVLEPLVVRGRVVLANGSVPPEDHRSGAGVPDGSVTLGGGIGTTIAVNETGHFTLSHRPVVLPAGANSFELRYRPRATSGYLGSEATVRTTIEAREPTIEILEAPERVGFGDSVAVETRLTVDGQSIEGVPLETTLGGVPVGSTVTGGETTTVPGSVPAGIDDGQSELRVAVPVAGRAVARANSSRSIALRETETELTLDVTASSPDRVRIRGRLLTDDGTAVPDQDVQLAVGGIDVGRPTTNATGFVTTTVAIDDLVDVARFEDRRVPVNASFAAPATNLAPARASIRVAVPAPQPGSTAGRQNPDEPGSTARPQDSGGLFGLGVPWWGWLAVVLLVAGLGVLFVRRRRQGAMGGAGPSISDEAGIVEGDRPASGGEPDESSSLLRLATEHLAAGAADTATEASYEAVRQRLAERMGVSGVTHWEFYRACQAADLADTRLDAIRRLTEAYEYAAFAPESLSIEAAQDAVGAARETLEDAEILTGAD